MISRLLRVEVFTEAFQQLPVADPQPIEDLNRAGLGLQVHVRGKVVVEEGEKGIPTGPGYAELGVDADPVQIDAPPPLQLGHQAAKLILQFGRIGYGQEFVERDDSMRGRM
jgi:hypothetical protein